MTEATYNNQAGYSTQAVASSATTPLDRHATALANIQQMMDDLRDARDEIAQLKADAHRESDRIVLLNEEREHYRKKYLAVKSKLVELATSISNIGLLTIKAQEVMDTVQEEDGA